MDFRTGHTGGQERFETRSVGWEGAVNARDLGGLAGVVRHRRVYRMGRHEWLTDKGWQQAYDDGVRTVVDLRNPGEFGRRETDPVLGDAMLERFAVVNCPTEDQSDAEFMELVGPYLSSPEYYRENLRRWPEKIAAAVRAVIDAPDGGVVVHCSAGRDRTGMVTMVLLSVAGVSADKILEDYALAVRGINAHHLRQEKPPERPKSEAELVVWLDQAQRHLAELLADFDGEQYLRDAGLSSDEVAALKVRLTA